MQTAQSKPFNRPIREFGEFHLIRQINRWVHRNNDSSLVLGIGDDAAVMRMKKNRLLTATVDGMVEHIHFSRSSSDWYSIGWKAAAMNLSDLAAMGALPRWMLIQLTLTGDISVKAIRQIYRGLGDCSSRYQVQIAGGNVARSVHECSLIITALGDNNPSTVIRREGARVGDRIVLTGYTGLSAAGLMLLKTGTKNISHPAIRRHLRPIPRVSEMQQLLKEGIRIHAAIDISDGLTADLNHLCQSSGTGAIIERNAIPLHPALRRLAKQWNKDPYEWALFGGEDYELILVIPEKEWLKAQKMNPQLVSIGKIIRQKELLIQNDLQQTERIEPKGYTHF